MKQIASLYFSASLEIRHGVAQRGGAAAKAGPAPRGRSRSSKAESWVAESSAGGSIRGGLTASLSAAIIVPLMILPNRRAERRPRQRFFGHGSDRLSAAGERQLKLSDRPILPGWIFKKTAAGRPDGPERRFPIGLGTAMAERLTEAGCKPALRAERDTEAVANRRSAWLNPPGGFGSRPVHWAIRRLDLGVPPVSLNNPTGGFGCPTGWFGRPTGSSGHPLRRFGRPSRAIGP
jgi:hypothetical protein